MKKLRGICSLDLFSKWYMAVLVMICRRQFNAFNHTACTFAYKPACNITDVLLILKLVLRKTYDWRGSEEIIIGIGDINKAFGNTLIYSLYNALETSRFPSALITALVAESRKLVTVPLFEGLNLKGENEKILWDRCIKQNKIEGPWVFDMVLS